MKLSAFRHDRCFVRASQDEDVGAVEPDELVALWNGGAGRYNADGRLRCSAHTVGSIDALLETGWNYGTN